MTERRDRWVVMPVGDMDVLIEPDDPDGWMVRWPNCPGDAIESAPRIPIMVTARPTRTIIVNRITMTSETSQAFDVIALRIGNVVYGTSEIVRRNEFILLGWIVVYAGQPIVLTVVNKTAVAVPFIATLIGKTPEATL